MADTGRGDARDWESTLGRMCSASTWVLLVIGVFLLGSLIAFERAISMTDTGSPVMLSPERRWLQELSFAFLALLPSCLLVRRLRAVCQSDITSMHTLGQQLGHLGLLLGGLLMRAAGYALIGGVMQTTVPWARDGMWPWLVAWGVTVAFLAWLDTILTEVLSVHNKVRPSVHVVASVALSACGFLATLAVASFIAQFAMSL